MHKSRRFLAWLLCWTCWSAMAQDVIPQSLQSFTQVYKQQLGGVLPCQKDNAFAYRLCSTKLRNAEVAPFVLHHGRVTEKVFILFHGLSDSPFYFSSIARHLHQQGHNVVVGLLPAHGLKLPDETMQTGDLGERWTGHTEALVQATAQLGRQVILGGFSTGGALALNYSLTHEGIDGLMLFSGAMALAGWFENLTLLPGMFWVGNLMDGDYQGSGPNPYKYPKVSSHGAVHLMALIRENRRLLEQQALNLPLFIAHSEADKTTFISGIDDLVSKHRGALTEFRLPKADKVCHADLVLNPEQVAQIDFDASQLQEITPCAIPKANPKHAAMLEAITDFVNVENKN